MVAQCVYYWQIYYRRDPAWMKLYVWFLLFVDTVGTVLSLTWIYGLLINNFNDLPKFKVQTWVLASAPALAGFTGMFCQLFFAYRIRVLTNCVWLGVGLAVLSVICALCAVGVSIAIGIVVQTSLDHTFNAIAAIWLLFTSLLDIVITGIVSWNLRRSRSDFMRTKDFLSRMVVVTVSTCAMTTVCAITELAFFLGKPETGLHLAFIFMIPKLYCNSVLSSLNARGTRGVSGSPTMDDVYVEFSGTQDSILQGILHRPRDSPDSDLVVHVAQETHEMTTSSKVDPLQDKNSQAGRECTGVALPG
ncbi:hypothetical protein PLICRDRAFT_41994 [Plicaturopsis crispa FD-325 SS-3]|nr:hypothetical protein PLICRDRAFT_41994 [Plicaturopsis crispa FD-325 SS-3]